MIHGGSHVLFSRKDVRPAQTRTLLGMGFLPVSIDHRLCPETKLVEGPMVDVCDALDWARDTLPVIDLGDCSLKPDGGCVVAVGWSSGGQLAMSLAWTAPQRGLEPPAAILALYCPTDYEDDCEYCTVTPTGAHHGKGRVHDSPDLRQGGNIQSSLAAPKMLTRNMTSWMQSSQVRYTKYHHYLLPYRWSH